MLVLVCLGGALFLSGGTCTADSGICTFPRRAGMSFGPDVSRKSFGALEVDKEKCVKAMQIPQVRPTSMHFRMLCMGCSASGQTCSNFKPSATFVEGISASLMLSPDLAEGCSPLTTGQLVSLAW